MRYRVRVVHRQPERHVTAAVMPRNRKPVMAQRAHQSNAVPGHRPLGVRRVIGSRRRLRRLTVTPQVRADHGMRAGQQRRDAMPGRMRARMPMQQQHRRPGAPVPDPQHHLADRDPVHSEPTEPLSRHPISIHSDPHRIWRRSRRLAAQLFLSWRDGVRRDRRARFGHGYARPSPDAAGFRARGWSQRVTCPR